MRLALPLPVKLGFLLLAFALAVAALTKAACPNDANPVQKAYCEAREAVLALEENSIEQAKAWEDLAVKEGHDQSTVTGLGGQKNGNPNYAAAEAYCWNNAGYAYWQNCNYESAVRCLEKSLATPGINSDCRTKATGTLKAARGKTEPPGGCKG